jgi:hypothetical protein
MTLGDSTINASSQQNNFVWSSCLTMLQSSCCVFFFCLVSRFALDWYWCLWIVRSFCCCGLMRLIKMCKCFGNICCLWERRRQEEKKRSQPNVRHIHSFLTPHLASKWCSIRMILHHNNDAKTRQKRRRKKINCSMSWITKNYYDRFAFETRFSRAYKLKLIVGKDLNN